MRALNINLLISIITFVSAQTNDAVEPEWSYDDPDAWGGDCDGDLQSPIYLSTANSINSAVLPPLTFENYDIPLTGPLTLSNNGHSVSLDLTKTLNGNRPLIKASIYKNYYEAVALHFHWGSRDNKGSEHVIDGQSFDVEMHIVHKNIFYETMEEAVQYDDGIAVLGVMIEKENDPVNYYPALYKILKKVPQVIEYQSETKINYGFTLDNVLGDLYRKEFFTYRGSLTTPPCSEAVTWFVFPDPIPIRTSVINQLYNLKDENNDTLINNYRPLQDLNGREVFYRYHKQSFPILPTLPSLPNIPFLPSLPQLPIIG